MFLQWTKKGVISKKQTYRWGLPNLKEIEIWMPLNHTLRKYIINAMIYARFCCKGDYYNGKNDYAWL